MDYGHDRYFLGKMEFGQTHLPKLPKFHPISHGPLNLEVSRRWVDPLDVPLRHALFQVLRADPRDWRHHQHRFLQSSNLTPQIGHLVQLAFSREGIAVHKRQFGYQENPVHITF